MYSNLSRAQQLGGASSEEIKVPDKLVGLGRLFLLKIKNRKLLSILIIFFLKVIGKGGDQLHRLQSETQCKIMIAPESNGQSDRVFTILGAKENIE